MYINMRNIMYIIMVWMTFGTTHSTIPEQTDNKLKHLMNNIYRS